MPSPDALFERETILRFSEAPEEPLLVYTFRRPLALSLLKKGGVLRRVWRREGKISSWTIEVPREWFRPPRPPTKQKLSPAQLEARRARGMALGALKGK